MPKLRPLLDHVVVRRHDPQHKIGTIHVPATAQEKQTFGEVLAVGPGRMNAFGTVEPLALTPGDVVVFDRYGAQEINVGGEPYVLLRAEQVLAVVDER